MNHAVEMPPVTCTKKYTIPLWIVNKQPTNVSQSRFILILQGPTLISILGRDLVKIFFHHYALFEVSSLKTIWSNGMVL